MHRVQSNYVHFRLRCKGISQREDIIRVSRFFLSSYFAQSPSPLLSSFVHRLSVQANGVRRWSQMRRQQISVGLFQFILNLLVQYFIQHCFICRPSDSTVSEDDETEPRTVPPLALAVRPSNHSARSHPIY